MKIAAVGQVRSWYLGAWVAEDSSNKKPRITPGTYIPCWCGYSKIKMAAAIVVVHRPFLSPTALCVMFAVRTILFDMR